MRLPAILRTICVICCAGALVTPGPAGEPVDDVFYHFMPIAWRDSGFDPNEPWDAGDPHYGDFDGMIASLDYLEYLGVTAIWMNPIFPSPAYHGYQHGAADTLNTRFGSEAQFISFVEAAHARGIKVFIDYVAYGISHDSIWFQSAYGNPSSPYDDWLAFENSANTWYLGSSYTTWNGDTVGFIHWDLRHPSPVNLVTTWAQHWLDPDNDGNFADGVDGYRLDHVWEYYSSGPDGWGYNIDSFWVPWKQALQSVNPDVFTFAEQADWGSWGVELMPAHDATMTKPLEFGARDALANELAASLYSQAEAAAALQPADRLFVGIIGDHDVDRLATAIGGSMAKGKVAAAVLMTLAHPPIIYYGDELGMLGWKQDSYAGDAKDIPMREPFKWKAIAGAPMSNYDVLYPPAYNNRFSQNNDGRSVEEQLGVSGSLLEEYRLLIAARKAHIALRRGAYYSVYNNNEAVYSFVRHHDDQQMLVVINLSGYSESVSLDLSDFPIPGGTTTPYDVLNEVSLPALTEANKDSYPMGMAAYSYRIMEVQIDPPDGGGSAVDGREIPTDLGAGALVATQDNATGLGDNVSELDQLFIDVSGEMLSVGITGNLATDGTGLALFFDTVSGGQTVLDLDGASTPPEQPPLLTGLEFDAGFAPDHLYFVNANSATFWVDQYELLTGGGVDKTYRGQGTVNDGDGVITGGSNPNQMECAFDNTNTAGVTDTSATGADTATTGLELLVPLVDIGLATPIVDPIRVCVFIFESNGDVSNQWLPGLGGGWSNLGETPDMTTVPGDQFATVTFHQVGDMNCDGSINNGDIDAFVLAISDAAGYAAAFPDCDIMLADVNADGFVNNGDIDAFVALLSG